MLSRARERLLRRIATRKGREMEAVVLVEGPRAVEAVLDAGAKIRFALHPEGSPPPQESKVRQAEVEVISVAADRWLEFTDTEAPQDLAAVVEEPRPLLPPPGGSGGEWVLLLDRVQDPGNAGTLIRSAAALGVDRVLVLDGSVDPWNPKAVRAAAGTGFLLPVHLLPWEEAGAWLEAAELPIFVANGDGEPIDTFAGAPGAQGWVLAVGNEGVGVRPEVRAAGLRSLAIPMARGVESLNVGVAGSLLLWSLAGTGSSRSDGVPHPSATPVPASDRPGAALPEQDGPRADPIRSVPRTHPNRAPWPRPRAP